ncbi:MAG: Acid sugar phosphatase [Alphaproteobacteria bacterium MarineAlpha4_Bin2]|nr:MAG: Acid sugar phosphatase [Alphaproteobacteria bacterium MarineAlpha4_Bin2]
MNVPTPKLRLALVTDIHHGEPKLTKRSDMAIPLLHQFVEFANEWRPDLVVDLGDRISDKDNMTDRELTGDVAGVFQRVTIPRRHIVGNHDQEFMSREEGEELLGSSLASESIDIKGFHLVFWQAGVRYDRYQGFTTSQSDIDWLAQNLAATDKPSIVFSHVPLDGASMIGNYYFEANQHCAQYDETPQIRRVLREAGNVVLCVAGHVHWNKANTVDGIPYLSLQSLTESFTTAPAPTGAWSTIEVGDDIHWRCYGADPVDMRLSLGRSWIAPLPSFEELRRRRDVMTWNDTLAGLKGVLFDLDGVVYRGETPIEGASDLFNYLRETGRAVGAITNNALKTGNECAEKLARMGIDLAGERIFTSGWAAARHVVGSKPGAKVFIVGGDALRRELLDAGAIESTAPDFVVAGIDLSLTIQRLSDAAVHVRNGASLIVTNPDRTVPIENGVRAGAGAVQAFIEAAGGRAATVIGKPQAGIFQLAMEGLGLRPEETIMVGDTAETDIAGAEAAGIRSVLVESGNANDKDVRATVVASGVAELLERLREADAA